MTAADSQSKNSLGATRVAWSRLLEQLCVGAKASSFKIEEQLQKTLAHGLDDQGATLESPLDSMKGQGSMQFVVPPLMFVSAPRVAENCNPQNTSIPARLPVTLLP